MLRLRYNFREIGSFIFILGLGGKIKTKENKEKGWKTNYMRDRREVSCEELFGRSDYLPAGRNSSLVKRQKKLRGLENYHLVARLAS